MNISELIKSGQQVQVVINALDLKEAFLAWEVERMQKDKQPQPEALLTKDEACSMLRCSRGTLHNWWKSKRLIPVKIGRKNFYRKDDILKIIGQ